MSGDDNPEGENDDAEYLAEREKAYRGIAIGLAPLAVAVLLVSIAGIVVVLLHVST